MEKLDKADKEILQLLQENCRLSAREIAKKTGSLTTTVYAKIRRMEQLGVIKGYHAEIEGKTVDRGVKAIVLVSFDYHSGKGKALSQRDIAKQVASFAEVQDVHIISGDWDLSLKVVAENVDKIGQFVIDKLRKIDGIDKVTSNLVFGTEKESLQINI
jgi:DNA-binding Lrp family transcriptional regulator|tara:strand:- start:2479 stop:2952 length:474 start_codon:yes stop_codon:yes gene_type:complete